MRKPRRKNHKIIDSAPRGFESGRGELGVCEGCGELYDAGEGNSVYCRICEEEISNIYKELYSKTTYSYNSRLTSKEKEKGCWLEKEIRK